MDKLININEEGLFDTCTEIAELCQPLLTKFNITGFNYKVNYFNGEILSLCSDQAWLQYYFNKQLYQHLPSIMPAMCSNNYVLWDNLPDNQIFHIAQSEFDIAHVFSIINRHKDKVELFNFSTTANNEFMNNWYINNLDILLHFCNFFVNHAHNIIQKAPVYKPVKPTSALVVSNIPCEQALKNEFMRQTAITQWQGVINDQAVHLTQREIDCFRLLVNGSSAKDIAHLLNLSPRTVENHLSRLKKKVCCYSKSQLIKALLASNFKKTFIQY